MTIGQDVKTPVPSGGIEQEIAAELARAE